MNMNNVILETDYRIGRLKDAYDHYSGKKIAIYGIGDNAKVILDRIPDMNVLCLIDGFRVGEYYYGKKIVSLEDTLILGIEVIIIAAISSSAVVVEERIIEYCISNGIALLDMYGCDAINRKRELMVRELGYPMLKYDDISAMICENDVICIEPKGIIYDDVFDDAKSVINDLFYRSTIIGQVKQAIDDGKRVYFIRNEDETTDEVTELLKKVGIFEYEGIIPHSDAVLIRDGAWREDMGRDFGKKTLFVGCAYNEKTMLAYDYNMSVVIIKRVQDMLKEIHGAHIDKKTMVSNCSREFVKTVCEEYNSPYPDDMLGARIKKEHNNCMDRDKKLVLVINMLIPRYDCDAGSKTIYQYIKLFIRHGYKVCIMPGDFARNQYAEHFEGLGAELLVGDYFRNHYQEWVLEHAEEIAFAFVSYPECGARFYDLLSLCGIRIVYYGIDLHYMRKRREYELTGDVRYKHESENYYKLEKFLISSVDVAYYPSHDEVDIVSKEFGLKAYYLTVLFYDRKYDFPFIANERNGMMFIGGYRHQPNVDAVKWFVKEVFPLIWRKQRIPFYIVGSDEPIELREIDHPGIIHVGHISDEELEHLYQTIRMVVIPLRYGAGVKGKVVDALYRGIPIVSTSIGIEGIPEADRFVCHADDPESFAKCVNDSYNDYNRLDEISREFKELAWKYYSEETAWDSFEKDVLKV